MNQFSQQATELAAALTEFQANAGFKPGNLIVVGCSTSEVTGCRIGKATNMDVSRAILPVIITWARQNELHIAIQCCEHLNRCLVVEEACARKYGLEEVTVIPYEKAGGGIGAAAMELFDKPVVAESLNHQAHGGLDIGNTFIGMHLRRVAVCVRLSVTQIGAAPLNCVRTRPILIGGARARYTPL